MKIKTDSPLNAPSSTPMQHNPMRSLFLPEEERMRYLELVNAGRIVAVLGWVDHILLKRPEFGPMADEIQVKAMQLDLQGLRSLMELFGDASTGSI